MKKVSIIVPVYNVQNYLAQCLDSLLVQSYINWEAILIDDGSTDKSGSICDYYATLDSRFKVFHQINGGAASAKNIGLDHITGEYVAFIDSDDYVEPHWIKRLVTVAESQNADVVEFDFDKVFRTYSETGNSYTESVKVFSAETYLAQYISNWTSSLFTNKLFDSNLIKQIRFRKERRCIDDEFFTYKVISSAHKIVRISEVLYHYRQRVSSAVTNQKNQQQITDDALEVLIERYEWICERFPHLRKIYLCHDVDIMFFFAGFNHTEDTVKKFRSIARYYLWQTLRYKPYGAQLRNAIKLQMISAQKFFSKEQEEAKEEKTFNYFE